MQGVVLKFNNRLGYGFMKSKEYENDIFVHYSEIKEEGYKSLRRGDHVLFDFDKDKVKAINVKKIKHGFKKVSFK